MFVVDRQLPSGAQFVLENDVVYCTQSLIAPFGYHVTGKHSTRVYADKSALVYYIYCTYSIWGSFDSRIVLSLGQRTRSSSWIPVS